MIQSLLSLLVASVAITSYLPCTHASTHQLSYDGFVPMKVIENNSIPGITEAVTKLIASSINNCNDINDDKHDAKTCALRNKQLELNCFPRKSFADVDVDVDVNDEPVIIGMKCIADHRRAGFSFAITTFVHLPDGDDDFTNIDGPMAITVDATVYHDDDDDISRDLLVKAVSVIKKSTAGASTGSATSDTTESNWKIQERDAEYYVDLTVSPSASIEKKLLSNDAIEDKVQVFSSTSPSTSTRTDIWEYGLIATTESHRDLFIDSTLRATTTAAGRAHAEAFVHPAIIANINPKRVAIISDMPVAYVKEILKYKSVIDVTIVGSNQEAVEAVKTYMPQLNDCSLIENVADSCMDDERLEIISGDDNGNNDVVVSTWMERMVHECKDVDYFNECAEDPIMCETEPAYDVILVDIANPDQADQWLSHEFYGMLNAISTQETMTAFNIGSAPSVEGGNEYEARNEFIEIVEEYRFKDTDDAIMVYDEPAAEPLNTAFFLKTMEYSGSYYRFVRDAPTAMDMDIITLMQPQPLQQTEFYDGATHLRYLKPSRIWENWFCQSNFGQDKPECTEIIQKWYDPSNHGYKFEVVTDPIKGRSLRAAEDIPQGVFIQGEDTFMHLHINAHQWESLEYFVEEFPEAKMYQELQNFFITYGFQNESRGESGWSVSIASTNTFTNHGCTEKDQNASPFPFSSDEKMSPTLSIVINRRPQFGMITAASRDIKKGDEIMMDYSSFRTYPDEKFTEFLAGICKTGVGLVDAQDGSNLNSCIDNGTCY